MEESTQRDDIKELDRELDRMMGAKKELVKSSSAFDDYNEMFGQKTGKMAESLDRLEKRLARFSTHGPANDPNPADLAEAVNPLNDFQTMHQGHREALDRLQRHINFIDEGFTL